MRLKKQLRTSGLTLIELLVVVTVMLLLASLAMTAVKGLLKGQKVAQAAVTVRQYLQNAQIRALASGRPTAVFFGPRKHGWKQWKPYIAELHGDSLAVWRDVSSYTGDVVSARGTLRDVDFTSTYPDPTNSSVFATSRGGLDNHADEISFNLADVGSAFGNGNSSDPMNLGFVKPGDLIEFRSFKGRYVIESYRLDPNNANVLLVQFFNPPEDYSRDRRQKKNSGATLHSIYEAIETAAVEPIALTPTSQVEFSIYRQPTRSLVGSVVLPRGTCIDLSVSGVGILDNAVDGGNFALRTNPPNSVSRGDFSRIGLVFSPEGRLSYLLDEDSSRTTMPKRMAVSANSMVFLMVGRTDQVLPGFTGANGRTQVFQHDDPDINPNGSSEFPKANLVDPENIWITCNPFTGEIRTSPTYALSPAEIAAGLAATSIGTQVKAARSMAAAGLSNRE